MVFLLMGGAYLRSRIKQAGKWDQETIVSFFLCQYCSGEYLPNLNGSQSVAILGSALSQNRGLVGINQGAGEGNQQLNAFALSLDDSGLGVVTDINLSSSVAKTPGGKPPANTTTSIYLDDTALTGSKGVIQVNQVTGQGNQSVNMVSLPLAGAVTASP